MKRNDSHSKRRSFQNTRTMKLPFCLCFLLLLSIACIDAYLIPTTTTRQPVQRQTKLLATNSDGEEGDNKNSGNNNSNNPDHDILVRAAAGERTSRPPVWLMRQAGRYMAAFREFSNKYPFRERSETPEIAIELSLQPWKAYETDGVIMFSDILTPLPGMGIEFDVIKGKGPVIADPIRSKEMIEKLRIIDEEELQNRFGFLSEFHNFPARFSLNVVIFTSIFSRQISKRNSADSRDQSNFAANF